MSGRPVRPRVAARALAVQLLYAWEAHRFCDPAAMPGLLTRDERLAAAPEALAEAGQMAAGVARERQAVDAAIDQRLTNWTIHRLAATDRAILRLAAWELLYELSVPPKVAISQAVALAREYGSDDKTPRLINGVLDRLARDHRGLGQPAKGA